MVLTEFDEQKYTDMIRAEGKAEGLAEMLVKAVELFSSKHNVDISTACEELGYTRKDTVPLGYKLMTKKIMI